jgi:hypothetical protein
MLTDDYFVRIFKCMQTECKNYAYPFLFIHFFRLTKFPVKEKRKFPTLIYKE